MTFGLQMHTVDHVRSWQDAARLLEASSQYKKRDCGSYPLAGKEKNSSIDVRLTHDGIKFRYWHTDVITWHPDNSYTFEPYMSRSTCTFFNRLSPHHLTRDGEVLDINGVSYPVCGGGNVTVKDGVPTGGLGLFSKEYVNREGAKKVLAGTRYAEYRAWHKVMSPLLTVGSSARRWWSDADVYAALRNKEQWTELATATYGQGQPDRVREAIYMFYSNECFMTKTFRSLDSQKACQSAYRVIPAE